VLTEVELSVEFVELKLVSAVERRDDPGAQITQRNFSPEADKRNSCRRALVIAANANAAAHPILSASIFDFAPTVRDLAWVRVLVFPDRFLPQTSGSALRSSPERGWPGRLFVKVAWIKEARKAYWGLLG
jgi:hypothetical protein